MHLLPSLLSVPPPPLPALAPATAATAHRVAWGPPRRVHNSRVFLDGGGGAEGRGWYQLCMRMWRSHRHQRGEPKTLPLPLLPLPPYWLRCSCCAAPALGSDDLLLPLLPLLPLSGGPGATATKSPECSSLGSFLMAGGRLWSCCGARSHSVLTCRNCLLLPATACGAAAIALLAVMQMLLPATGCDAAATACYCLWCGRYCPTGCVQLLCSSRPGCSALHHFHMGSRCRQ